MDGHGAGLNEADGVDHAADGHGREFPLARVTDANYVFLDCWNQVLANIAVEGKMSDSSMFLIQTLIPKALNRVFEIVNRRNAVTMVKARRSGRRFFQVLGSKSERYVCFDNFCTCAHATKQLGRGNAGYVACKHVYAVGLVVALGSGAVEEIEDADFARHMGDALDEAEEETESRGGGYGQGSHQSQAEEDAGEDALRTEWCGAGEHMHMRHTPQDAEEVSRGDDEDAASNCR